METLKCEKENDKVFHHNDIAEIKVKSAVFQEGKF